MTERNLKPSGNPNANLRSQPALWHMIRKETQGQDTCFACGSSRERMELHEEWSKAENGDTVLMGLFWLCEFCHVKREGHWLDEEESELTRTTMILTGWKVSKLNGFPINSEYEWNLIDIDGEIEEIRRRDDYSPRGGRYHLGFYWGKPEDTCIIDFGPNYIEARRIFFLDVRESIWSSQTYQSILKNYQKIVFFYFCIFCNYNQC